MKKFVPAFSLLFLVQSAAAALPTHKTHPEDFFYAQQTSLWVFFKAPKSLIQAEVGSTLDSLGFEVASFEDPSLGYIVVKPMVFMAEFGHQTASVPGTSASTEVELTLLVYPKNKRPRNSETFENFLHGRVKNSSIGQLRLDVLCDHEVAVAAGRKNFGEHKFLGSFEYSYPTPNNQLRKTEDFRLDMTAYTWKGAGQNDRKMFRIKTSLSGLKPRHSPFSPELLYSAFPPEPEVGIRQTPVGEFRRYDNRNFQAYSASPSNLKIELIYGEATGAEPLKPVPPFGDGKAIPGSENWPQEMVSRMKAILAPENAIGFLLYRSPPAEYESKPFELR